MLNKYSKSYALKNTFLNKLNMATIYCCNGVFKSLGNFTIGNGRINARQTSNNLFLRRSSKIINKIIIMSLGCIGLISGCASTYTKTSNHCLTYTISGDKSEEWTPIDFYQDEAENKLYIQLPKYINYVPTLRVMDTEYDQPYTVDYKYNKATHQLEVRDNYDQYVLTRNAYDDLSPDKVYVTCNRSMMVKKNK